MKKNIKQKKLLMYLTFPLWPRLEEELDIIQKYLNSDFKVCVVACTGQLKRCPPNPNHRKIMCKACNSRLSEAMATFDTERVILRPLSELSKNEINIYNKNFNSKKMDEIKAIEIENSDIGMSVYSELMSEPVGWGSKNRLLEKLIKNALIVHTSFKKIIKDFTPDEVIIFNGRITAYRPAFRLSRRYQINTKIFEAGYETGKYILTEGYYPHDANRLGEDYKKVFKESNLSESQKKKLTDEHFMQRIVKERNYFNTYSRKFQLGYVSKRITDLQEFKVGIFISTEAEMLGIKESDLILYKNQNHAIETIARDLQDTNIKLIVRAHPHLQHVQSNQYRELQKMSKLYKNLILISPKSKVDSHELIKHVDAVLTFYSSIGIESIYEGKPTIVLGPAVYRNFGGSINPADHTELIKLLSLGSITKQIKSPILPSPEAMNQAAQIFVVGEKEFSKYVSCKSHDLMSSKKKRHKMYGLLKTISKLHQIILYVDGIIKTKLIKRKFN